MSDHHDEKSKVCGRKFKGFPTSIESFTRDQEKHLINLFIDENYN